MSKRLLKLMRLFFGAGGDVSIPSWVRSVAEPTDYGARFESKRRQLRSSTPLRGPKTGVIGPEPTVVKKSASSVSELYPVKESARRRASEDRSC